MKKVLVMLISIYSISITANWDTEKEKIDYLLKEVSESKVIFIRNGSTHPPKDAAKHLERKLKSALSSWFTPSKEKWTAKLFIEKVASKSSLSGKEYKIKRTDGSIVKAKVWLNEKLNKYQQKKK